MLEVKNLHATIAGKEILKGINLTINDGEIHAIMGPNGSCLLYTSHLVEQIVNTDTLLGTDFLALILTTPLLNEQVHVSQVLTDTVWVCLLYTSAQATASRSICSRSALRF